MLHNCRTPGQCIWKRE